MLGWCIAVCFCCISEGTNCTVSILFMVSHADMTVLVVDVCVSAVVIVDV